jgi:hypothetical protein
MEEQICDVLFNIAGIPYEVTHYFIIPHLNLLSCGCLQKQKNNKCPKYKINKGILRTCIRCNQNQVFKESHYCIFCKCNKQNCHKECVSYLKYCQDHLLLNGKMSEKGLWNRLKKCYDCGISTESECIGIAKEFKFRNIERQLIRSGVVFSDICDNGTLFRIYFTVKSYEKVLRELESLYRGDIIEKNENKNRIFPKFDWTVRNYKDVLKELKSN